MPPVEIVGARRVIGDVRRAGGIAPAGLIEGARDVTMKQLAAGLRDGAVGGPADEVMGEIVGILAHRPHQSAPLQFFERREQIRVVEPGGTREVVGRERARDGRGPQEHLASVISEARKLPPITASIVGPGSASPR